MGDLLLILPLLFIGLAYFAIVRLRLVSMSSDINTLLQQK
jgi:hypothetical protein